MHLQAVTGTTRKVSAGLGCCYELCITSLNSPNVKGRLLSSQAVWEEPQAEQRVVLATELLLDSTPRYVPYSCCLPPVRWDPRSNSHPGVPARLYGGHGLCACSRCPARGHQEWLGRLGSCLGLQRGHRCPVPRGSAQQEGVCRQHSAVCLAQGELGALGHSLFIFA